MAFILQIQAMFRPTASNRSPAKETERAPVRWWQLHTVKAPRKAGGKPQKAVRMVRADTLREARELAPLRRNETIEKCKAITGLSGILESMAKGIDPNKMNVILGECAPLLRGGIPLHQAFKMQVRRTKDPHVRYYLDKVVQAVGSGRGLAESFGLYPEICGSRLLALLKVAETSGNLAVVFEKVREAAINQEKIAGKIRGQLIYPYLVSWVAFGIFMLLAIRVMPEIARMYATHNAPLPAVSRPLFFLGGIVVQAPVLSGVIGACALVLFWLKKEALVKFRLVQAILYRIPKLGDYLKRVEFGSALTSLAISMQAGDQLLSALELAGGAFNHREMREAWDEIAKDIRVPVPVADAFENHAEEFGQSGEDLAAFVRLGEAGGNLGAEMVRLAESENRALVAEADDIAKITQPMMTLFLVGTVGNIIVPVQTAMFQVGSVMLGR
jgi:type II secretory pathway component PulF